MDVSCDSSLFTPTTIVHIGKLREHPPPIAPARYIHRDLGLSFDEGSSPQDAVQVAPDHQGAGVTGRHGRSLIDNPEALAAKIAQDPAFLTRLSYVITDHNFDGSLHDGLDVGRMVKNQRRDLPVLLSSDAELRGSDLSGSIDAVIAKEPVGYRELRQLLVAFGRKVTTLV